MNAGKTAVNRLGICWLYFDFIFLSFSSGWLV
jgi:hypothetical protein